ncbi:hypothetical protein DPMN_041701 [Dreissena polymorpha]|uniref:Uncharacterized protein n=1 Tax=Dreissena polymorpha TaxID=45954 RepID=A0A9D4CXF1_DREPO|nr:hypothetical protein DPMN_041701 [Dreissena polymorpha]
MLNISAYTLNSADCKSHPTRVTTHKLGVPDAVVSRVADHFGYRPKQRAVDWCNLAVVGGWNATI